MADTKISALTQLTSASGDERVPVAEPDGGGGFNSRYLLASALGVPLAQGGAAVSHTGDTNETTLLSVVVPGGTLGANGQLLIDIAGPMTGSSSKTLRVKFGGVTFLEMATTTQLGYNYHRRIANQNNVAVQIGQPLGSAGYASNSVAPVTGAIDTSADQTLLVTGQLTNAADTIALGSWLVLARPRA